MIREVISDLDSNLNQKGYVCEAGDDWVCPDGHLKIQDRCYGFVMQNATYIEAEQSCQSIYHGHLARMQTFFHVSLISYFKKCQIVSRLQFSIKGIGSWHTWSKTEHKWSILDSRKI